MEFIFTILIFVFWAIVGLRAVAALEKLANSVERISLRGGASPFGQVRGEDLP